MDQIVLVLITFVAATVNGALGYGFSSITVPVALLFYTNRILNPALVLVGGSGPTDRDETVAGIPIFAELARALADAGYMVVRYDKRGVGQSGGRAESATLADYAEDLRAVLKYVSERKDVDRRRLAVAG